MWYTVPVFGAMLMDNPRWLIDLDRVHSSYLVLATLGLLGVVAGVLFQVGLLGWLLRAIGAAVRWGIRAGFRLWERLFALASWPVFLLLVLGLVGTGWAAADAAPGLTVLC